MKLNENIKICGQGVILIPYEKKHVEKYHTWMMDPVLRELTASEELSIEEEYEMQASWRNDQDKCTFLILDRQAFEKSNNEIESLVGDTNLFLQNSNETEDIIAEAEIMIADKSVHGRHFGWESMLLMLKYGQTYLNCTKFIVKIGYTNEKSIKMFSKIGFLEISRSEIFQEITYEKIIDAEWIKWLDSNIKYTVSDYCKF